MAVICHFVRILRLLPLPKVSQRLAVRPDCSILHVSVDNDGSGVGWVELFTGLLQLWTLLEVIYEVVVHSVRRDKCLLAFSLVNVGELTA